jgi:predicted nucleic acid-binding protein
MTPAAGLTIDASVALKLFFREEYSDRARAVFAGLAGGPPRRLLAPDFLLVECANVFRTGVKRRLLSAGAAREALAILRELPLRLVSTAELTADALGWALAHDLSVYDACYVAVAVRSQTRLLTADQKLANKLGDATPGALWLGDENFSAEI